MSRYDRLNEPELVDDLHALLHFDCGLPDTLAYDFAEILYGTGEVGEHYLVKLQRLARRMAIEFQSPYFSQ